MPEEANVCLNCLTTYGEEAVVATEKAEKIGAFVKIKSAVKAINKKKAAAICAAALCAMIIIPVAVLYGTGNLDQYITPDKSVVSPDAKVENKETKDDGSVVITYDDGTVSTENADGTIVTETTDGTVITQKTDGTVITQEKDGTVVTEKTDGTVITEKTDGTVITEKPDGTTEVTQVPTTQPTTATTQPATESTTKAGTTTTTTTTTSNNSENHENMLDNFTYEVKGTSISITAYTGNSTHVYIPNRVDGLNVSIETSTFSDNSTIQQITFVDTVGTYSQVYAKTNAIINCPNLKKITFDNVSIYYLDTGFAKNCPNLMQFDTGKNRFVKFENDALYSEGLNGNWKLAFYCEGSSNTSYTFPEWCDIKPGSNPFYYATNLRTITANSLYGWQTCYYSHYLEAFYIPDEYETDCSFDVDGVPFYKSSNRPCCILYPPMKKEASFTVPNNAIFNPSTSYVNYNLTTLVLPKDAVLTGAEVGSNSYYFRFKGLVKTFPNLTTIRIETGNVMIEDLKQNFDGTVIVY